jgi:hypothetical protein
MTERAGQACCIGVTDASMSKAAAAGRAMILPLALTQFIANSRPPPMAQAPKPVLVSCMPVQPSRVVGREVVMIVLLVSGR